MKKARKHTLLAWILLLTCISFWGCSAPPLTTPIQPSSEPTEQPIVTAEAPEPTERPTAEAAAPSATPSPVEEITRSLQGLPIDEFFEQSYRQLLLRSPESITAMGLAEEYGLRNDRLDDLSDAYIRETQALECAILDLLRTYDRSTLPPEQQVSYDVYEWYLDSLVRGHEFMYYDYPLNHFLNGYPFDLDLLLTEYHPLATPQDVEDYITRLSLVDDQVDQLMEGLAIREELGVIPPRFIVQLTQADIVDYLHMHSPDPAAIRAESLLVYTRLEEALDEMDGASAAEQQAYLDAALVEIEASWIPAYVEILDYLDHLLTIATDDAGVWALPNGDAYYAYLLQRETSTDLTATEIHEIGLAEVIRIQEEMRQAFTELGYPEDASLRELMERALDEGGYLNVSTPSGQEAYIAALETLIEEADQRIAPVFDAHPRGDVVVIGGRTGGYYVPGATDGSRPGAYHVSLEGSWRVRSYMPTVAYHETIPGHHFQIALAQEMDLPMFRNDIVLNGYAEGWALYAEQLAWEVGLYDDDPYGNLGRLQFELLRAVRLVVDTGIHALHWTREEAQEYMNENMPAPPGSFTHEVDRYIVMPAQATGYKIGMLKMLELRQLAMDRLGDQFDMREFHTVVLGSGSLPLDLLEQIVLDTTD